MGAFTAQTQTDREFHPVDKNYASTAVRKALAKGLLTRGDADLITEFVMELQASHGTGIVRVNKIVSHLINRRCNICPLPERDQRRYLLGHSHRQRSTEPARQAVHAEHSARLCHIPQTVLPPDDRKRILGRIENKEVAPACYRLRAIPHDRQSDRHHHEDSPHIFRYFRITHLINQGMKESSSS